CYTVSLGNEETLSCKVIKTTTIKKYLQAAASWATAQQHLDPRKTFTGTTAQIITKVLREQQRWERMPNRREPLTVEMLDNIHSQASIDLDCLANAMADWASVGFLAGLRKCEWAQDQRELGEGGFKHAPDGSPLAFIASDFTFFQADHSPMPWTSISSTNLPARVRITWRHQKNGDNGQAIDYFKDDLCPILCGVRATVRIRQRAIRLDISPNCPLGIFKQRNTVSFIRTKHIEGTLQSAARTVHHITSKQDLQRFTAHSLRVGACVALHSANCSETDIKFRLCWRSNAFMEYLRNVPAIARRQAHALHQIAVNFQTSAS
ncbi:MAG: hypothetical protein ACRDL7_08525, partial [Gaiellaceae bacterium]